MKSSSSRSTTPTPSQITDNRFIRNNNNQIIRTQQSGSRSPSPVLNFKPSGASINFNKQNGQINIINDDKIVVCGIYSSNFKQIIFKCT